MQTGRPSGGIRTGPFEPLQKKKQSTRNGFPGDFTQSDVIQFIDRCIREKVNRGPTKVVAIAV